MQRKRTNGLKMRTDMISNPTHNKQQFKSVGIEPDARHTHVDGTASVTSALLFRLLVSERLALCVLQVTIRSLAPGTTGVFLYERNSFNVNDSQNRMSKWVYIIFNLRIEGVVCKARINYDFLDFHSSKRFVWSSLNTRQQYRAYYNQYFQLNLFKSYVPLPTLFFACFALPL